MRQAEILYREGKLGAAIESLQGHLRDNPTSQKGRGFLFELLLFAGELDRAQRQLAMLGGDSQESQFGVAFYQAALKAEKERDAYYRGSTSPMAAEAAEAELSGRWDGQPFSGIRDADPRLAGSLEFLAGGAYYRMPFRHLQWVEFGPPRLVRDLYWLPSHAQTVESMQSTELDLILVPVLYPDSHMMDDDSTRLGRSTEWVQDENGVEFPCGQRLLIIGGEEVPLLSIRRIEFDSQIESAGGSHE